MSRKTNISKKPVVRDYGIQSYRAGDDKDYSEIIGTPTFFAANCATVIRESEYAKPYENDEGDDYSSMEYPWPSWPWLNYPGMDFPNMNFPSVGPSDLVIGYSGSGCGFNFPGLFSENERGETKCVYLSDFYTHSSTPGGDKVPDDPIVGWSITYNAKIVSAGETSACVRINDDAPYGSIVRLTATTKSGKTCNSMGWVVSACDDSEMVWDTEVSAETIAREDSCIIAIIDGQSGSPYTWSVSGTGFWFDAEHSITEIETSITSAFLYADETACGTATVTVTGCGGAAVTGYVRCAIGSWTFQAQCYQCCGSCQGFDPGDCDQEACADHIEYINGEERWVVGLTGNCYIKDWPAVYSACDCAGCSAPQPPGGSAHYQAFNYYTWTCS